MTYYSSVDAKLFQSIVDKYEGMNPARGRQGEAAEMRAIRINDRSHQDMMSKEQ